MTVPEDRRMTVPEDRRTAVPEDRSVSGTGVRSGVIPDRNVSGDLEMVMTRTSDDETIWPYILRPKQKKTAVKPLPKKYGE